jgi:hypothetical protein
VCAAPHIQRFLNEAKLTLVNLEPNDPMAGNDGYSVKVIAGEKVTRDFKSPFNGDAVLLLTLP